MGKVLFGVIAVLASLILAESLTCNNCPFGLAGFCIFPTSQVCATNASLCSTTKATFPALKGFGGFTLASCLDNTTSCGSTTSYPLLSTSYSVSITCCSTNQCNSGASATKTTLGAVASMAAVASLWARLL